MEEARSLFLECEQIYANVLGVDHEETLDAAMRAQTVGEEDEEESEEGEEDTDDDGLSETSQLGDITNKHVETVLGGTRSVQRSVCACTCNPRGHGQCQKGSVVDARNRTWRQAT